MSRSAGRRKRRVAIVTGTRAEYGLLTSTMAAVRQHPHLQLQLIVTGMHLLPKFGSTVRQIEHDGWTIDARIRMQSGSDDQTDQAAGLGRGLHGIARFLDDAGTDIVVVLGDRIEAMAGALAAVTTGRLLAHIHGGDVAPGDFDDSLRHAITKLAHVHLVATRDAARRVVRMGESADRVHLVGAPGLDRLRQLLDEHPRPRGAGGTALIAYHAWGRPAAEERRTMLRILRATRAAGLRRVITFPNSDRGHTGVISAIEQHVARYPTDETIVHRSMRRDDYLRALIDADVLIGNSSSGIIEAPLAGTPSINIGPRQAGRQPGGSTVLQTDDNESAIATAIKHTRRIPRRRRKTSVYGRGDAGSRIAHVLATTPLGPDITRKVITY